MSKHETLLIRRYWEKTGGTLVEEFPIVRQGPDRGRRLVDAIILTNWPTKRSPWREVDLSGEDVVVIQAKNNRLGMYLMGQGVFSLKLVRRHFQPRSAKVVLLCTKDDAEMQELLSEYPDVEVVVFSEGDVYSGLEQ